MFIVDKIQEILENTKTNNIKIVPGSAAFYYENSIITECSGTGALILFFKLKDDSKFNLAKPGWQNELVKNLKVDTWWLRRFYCGFELGRSVYTDTTNKTDIYWIDAKGKKHYLKIDPLTLQLIKLRNKYTKT